jgi:hypothetical protein
MTRIERVPELTEILVVGALGPTMKDEREDLPSIGERSLIGTDPTK